MRRQPPFFEIRQRAEDGDAFSQVLLGFLLEHGLKMAPSQCAAQKNYRRAAEQGFPPGQHALAMLVADNDKVEGIKWFRKAAEAGYAPSQFLLGCIYQDGELTEPNPSIALKWIEAAADQDYGPAILHLVFMYSDKVLLDKTNEKAMGYLRRAVDKEDVDAMHLLGELLVRSGSEEEINEGIDLLWRAAIRSHALASMFLASMYGRGLYGAQIDGRLHKYFLSRAEPQIEDDY